MSARIRRELERQRVFRAVRSVVQSLDRHAATRAASAMAFDAFLSLIPLTAFAGYVLSRLHQGTDLVLQPVLRAAPPDVARFLYEEFVRLKESPSVAPIGLTGFLWTSSSGIATAMGVFETIYNMRERPWYVRRALAAACVVAGLAAVPVIAGLGVLIGSLSGTIAWLVAVTLPAGLVTTIVAAFFRIAIQRPHVERRRIFPGAALTVALWSIVSALFSLYVATLGRYATFYGSLATVAIFLFWLWLLSLALLVGAELNARIERERAGVTSVPPPGKWLPPEHNVSDFSDVPRSPALPRDSVELLEAELAAEASAPPRGVPSDPPPTERAAE